MAVGDHQLLVGHQLLDPRRRAGVRDAPHAVRHDALAGFDQGLALRGFVQQSVDALLRIVIEHEQLAEVRARMPRQLEPVELGAFVRQFVAVNDSLRVLGKLRKADKTLADESPAALGMRKFLKVRIEGRRVVLGNDSVCNPLPERRRGARINVVVSRV